MTIQQAAALAKLALSPQEEAAMAQELARTLAFLQQMCVEDEPQADTPADDGSLRQDVPRPCLAQDALLAQAPERNGAYISVPKSFD